MSYTVVDSADTNPYSGASGLQDRQCRVRCSAAAIIADAGQVRLLLGWAYSSVSISAMYIGHKGSGDYDFDGTQVQVFFGGSAGATFSTDTWSDWVEYAVDAERDLIISFFLTSSAVPTGASSTSRVFGYATSTGGDPSETLAGSMSTLSQVVFVEAIEGLPAVIVYETVTAGFVGEYGLYQAHIEQSFAGLYHLLAPITPAGFVGQYSMVLEQAFVGRYGSAFALQRGMVGRYGDASAVQSALVGLYGPLAPVLAVLDGRYHLMHAAVAALDGRYAICSASVIAALAGRYDLRTRGEIMAALSGYYSLLPGATIQQIVCPVRIGGVSVRWSSVSWTRSEDSYLIEATIVLRDAAEFGSIAKQDAVEIDWDGVTYTLFVAAKLRSRSVSGDAGAAEYGADYTIIARSLTAALDAPYALPVTMSWPAATLASAIAADVIAPLSDLFTLDWRMEDWLQPGGTFFITDESPLEGLRKLAEIVGGIVQTSPGNAVIMRMADTVPPAQWATVAPAWTIEDSGLFSDSESEQQSNRYNVITVSNQGESDRSTRFIVEDLADYRKQVKGYRVPWSEFGLATSGGEWVTIENGGVVEELVADEIVEFVDGSSTSALPVHSQVSTVWLQAQLGAVTAAEDGSLVAEVSGQSLAKISYTTRCHVWIGTSDRDEEVQFYEVDL